MNRCFEEKDLRFSASSKEESWLRQMVQHPKGEDQIEFTRGVYRGAVEIEHERVAATCLESFYMLGPPVGRGDIKAKAHKRIAQSSGPSTNFQNSHAAPAIEVHVRKEIQEPGMFRLPVIVGVEHGPASEKASKVHQPQQCPIHELCPSGTEPGLYVATVIARFDPSRPRRSRLWNFLCDSLGLFDFPDTEIR